VAHAFLRPADRDALTRAVETLEARSAAELVIVVRQRSGPYLHADLIAGIVFGALILGVQLFSPLEFGLLSILMGPLLGGATVGVLTSRTSTIRRLLTPLALRSQAVRTGAFAAFHERGVGLTRRRSGVLLYISLLERDAMIVSDRGVLDAVPEAAWRQKVAAVEDEVRKGATGSAVAARLVDLGDILERAVPHRAGDVNQLSNAVVEQ